MRFARCLTRCNEIAASERAELGWRYCIGCLLVVSGGGRTALSSRLREPRPRSSYPTNCIDTVSESLRSRALMKVIMCEV
jgi:hypothetical protein